MDTYWRTRDFKTSARLHLQHWLFQSTLPTLLSPSILPNLPPTPRIADLASGNGAYLLSLSHSNLLPPTTQFYGFDIAPVHFPLPSHIPANVHLIERDVLAELPPDLTGTFDVVHIRAFGSLIKNSDCGPILTAARNLLRPGGYLQWEEADTSCMTATAAPGSSAEYSRMLLGILEQGGRATGTTYDWFANITDQCASAGFADSKLEKFPLRPEQYKAWTEDYLLVYEEVAMMVPRHKDAPGAPLTREKYQGLFDQVVKETNAGTVIHSQHLTMVTGRKG